MRFQNASQVRQVVEEMRLVDITAHSFNRARIAELFEGFPPFSAEEAEKEHVGRNVNFLEAPSLAHKARGTWNNAFLKAGNRYKITLDSGPVHKRNEWSASITKNLNWPLKRSLRYIEATRATGASVVMYGIGPKQWLKAKSWCPHEMGVEDLLVPSNTKVNLDNLAHFAIYRQYTPEELFRMTHGPKVDPGWTMELVRSEMKRVTEGLLSTTQNNLQDVENPEKLVRAFKANAGVLSTDIVPTCNVWDFYHWEEPNRWFRSMILADSPTAEGKKDGFIYKSKQPYASDRSQIIHFQFGDGAQVAPFLYHTVRSLGYLLYAICNLQNQLRCRFADAIFEATMQYFRVRNSEDRSRVRSVDLGHLGLVPSGLDFVKNEERWQVNGELVIAGLSQNRQLMSENAAAFVQDVDQGTQKELTATEVMARLNSANALVSSLLAMAYTYDRFEGIEICRRFCLKDTKDADIERFRRRCLEDGVPEKYLDVERWDVQPERVLGGGNKTLELAQAESLMSRLELFDPEAQQDIKREWVLATTDNPDQAEHWVPDRKTPSPARIMGQRTANAMMSGGPVDIEEGIDHISYVEGMISTMEGITEDVMFLVNKGHQPQAQQVMGLTNCYKHVVGHIQIVAQNPNEKQRVREWLDRLKVVMNNVKAWGQQLDQAHEAAQEQNGDGGKMAATVIQAQSKAKIDEARNVQKMRHTEQKFIADQQRRNVQTLADIKRQNAQTQAQIAATDMTTAANIRAKKATAEADAEAKANKPKPAAKE